MSEAAREPGACGVPSSRLGLALPQSWDQGCFRSGGPGARVTPKPLLAQA